MNYQEHRAVFALSIIMSIRMLGLFMILPVFSVYAIHMTAATPELIGITLGIYGFTQAIFQIPFGMLSDHLGRKPVIVIGLILLLLGSIIAAYAHSIYVLLFARSLQGVGAIGSTVLALLSDLTRDESRTKAMAMMGLSIGCAFTVAMIIGPMIAHWFSLSGIFWITALLSLCAMGCLLSLPTPKHLLKTHENIGQKLTCVFRQAELLKCNAGIFALHAILTALFIAIPLLLTHRMQLSSLHQVFLYSGVLILSFAAALPFIILAEKKRKIKSVFLFSIAIIFFTLCALTLFNHQLTFIVVLLLLFFAAFTILEATLPSLISKIAPAQNKGTAMGVYSTSQFLGIFAGGSLGGIVLAHAKLPDVFILCATIAFGWFLLAITMRISTCT